MFKKSYSFMLLAAFSAFSVLPQTSQATTKGEVETAILFNCNVSFHASGKSAYLGIGYTYIKGSGMMSCYDYVENVVEEIPLKVKIKGPGAGLGVTGLNISGGQTGIGLNESPDALLGKYVMVRGNGAIGVGGALSTGLRISKGSFQLALQIESTSGLGVGLDLLTVELDRDETRTVKKVSMPKPEKVIAPTPEVSQPVQQVHVPLAPVRVQFNQVVELVDENGRVYHRYQFIRK